MPGDTFIGFGAAMAIIGVLLFVVSGINGGTVGALGVLLLVIGFGMAVIGYLQRIASRK